jgi:hypothetical protein
LFEGRDWATVSCGQDDGRCGDGKGKVGEREASAHQKSSSVGEARVD